MIALGEYNILHIIFESGIKNREKWVEGVLVEIMRGLNLIGTVSKRLRKLSEVYLD